MASKDLENGGGELSGSDKAGQDVPKRPKWQRLLGIRRRQGRYLRWTLTKWGVALVILVVLGSVMGGFMEYTMQPEFCQSCHIMEPYYQAWHQSTHKDVSCLKCHFDPGLEGTLKGKWQASSQAIKYLTNTYGSKPHAEIHDESCLRSECHAKRLLEGKVNWAVPSSRGQGEMVTIRFDHTPHLKEQRRGKDLRCVSCHSQIVQGQHIVVTLDTCFLCHFKGLEHGRHEETRGGCKACHDAPKDNIRLATGMFDHGQYVSRRVGCENCHSDSIKGDGAVPKQVCWVCHNKPAQTSRYAETQFLHTAHISKHKVECSNCHIQIEHNLVAGGGFSAQPEAQHADATKSVCGQCHEQTHLGPDSLYRGVGGRGVPDMPSPMFRTQVDCIGCHKAKQRPGETAEVVGQTYLTVQESCDYCHGDKYKGRLDEWKKTVADNLAAAEVALARASLAAGAAKLNDMDSLKARRLLDDAAHNIRFVKLGHGVHNVNYTTALLNHAQLCCKQAETIVATGGSQ
jgi:nitrate/TMAO reductase-like tetraheme cytochrome c subunit